MTRQTTQKNKVVTLYESTSAASSFDSKSLPTILQWLKKQPKEYDFNALFLVRLVFFDGGFGNHTICTTEFRARINSSGLLYESFADLLSKVEGDDQQLYVQVLSDRKGNFKLIQADNPAFKATRLRWIGGDDPFIGCELLYDEASLPDSP